VNTSIVEWRCSRCQQPVSGGAGLLPAVRACSRCRRLVCSGCIARLATLRVRRVICRDCARRSAGEA
jgi:hypothetical protein